LTEINERRAQQAHEMPAQVQEPAMTLQTNETDAAAPQNPMVAWPIEAFQNATTTCLSAIEHGGGMQSEWQSFIRQRLEKDGSYPGKLMKCKTPSDFLQTQFEFINDFFIDYTNELQRMGEMMKDAANESLSVAQKNSVGSKPPVA
jgi:Phasin protein